MAVNAANARIFGSDDDAVYLAPLGTTLPTDLGELDPAFEDVGWLSDDGFTETPSDTVNQLRGHQGGRVIRTKITESGTQIKFTAEESKALTFDLQYQITEKATADGVTTITATPGRSVKALACVVDLFDYDGVTVHERRVYPRIEIGERAERTFTNGEISAMEFTAEVTELFMIITDQDAIADDESSSSSSSSSGD